jgi:hypothetical protein
MAIAALPLLDGRGEGLGVERWLETLTDRISPLQGRDRGANVNTPTSAMKLAVP